MPPDIVIVDSERATRRHLELALTPWGYSIGGFSDARTALKELVAEPPRLVVAELLLPGMDGFELLQGVRSGCGEGVQIMCITAVSWGRLSLAELLRKRFGARFLRKPFLKSEVLGQIHALIGPGKPGAAMANEWRIGVAEARRVEELARDFETRLIRVGGEYGHGRRAVRAHAHHPVKWKSHGDWISSQADNISAGGGMFIEGEAVPRLDEIIEVNLELSAKGRHLRSRARIANRILPAEATASGVVPGFGVELLELTDDDRHLLETLVRDLRAERGTAGEPEAEARGVPQTWLLLVGLDGGELLKRPGFLHRQDIELMAVPDAEGAIAFFSTRQPAVCVAREAALGPDPRKALARISEVAGEGAQILIIGNTGLSSLIAQGLCDVVLRPDTTMEMLIEELRERLGVPRRQGPRIPFRGSVQMAAGGQTVAGSIVNISTGGMLLRSGLGLPVGSDVDLSFDLPDAPVVTARGKIVRSRMDRGSSDIYSAVSFAELDDETATALSRFVQSQVNFRDYFAWLKAAYFSGRLDW
jgi:CheY-like chemotaxis protein